MAIITASASLLMGRQSFSVRRFDVHEMSGETGDSADRLLGVPRWASMIESPAKIDIVSMSRWQAMLVKLRGRVNHLAIWDFRRPAPLGTMRGTMTLSGAHAKGATSLVITAGGGQASTTLVFGDWLQIGSALTGQLVMVVDDLATANGSGVITVNVEHPLRAAQAGSTAVTWDKALGHYKLLSESVKLFESDGGMLQGGASAELMEQW